ncbi:MAG: Crp/Fnr family transcriptional regulator [Desulfitobacteriaceae bacterium]
MDINKVPFFKGLAAKDIKNIVDISSERIFPKGSTLFVEGQESDGLYIIITGLIKVFILSKDGREKTFAILGEGDIIGEMTLFGCAIRSATLQTMEQTTIMVIKREDFKRVLTEIPYLAQRIIELLSNRLRQANHQIEDLVFLNSRSRVINNLVQLARDRGKMVAAGNIQITFRLTHAELASLMGVSRETVTKVLSELQDSRLIEVAHKQIKIFSLDQLYREVL